ncbi:MAG: histidinol-phosphate transaminase [Proteobacteria bacterium]|nr:histidinol-phosphate transaminase [Pseudomonadota bacterium]NBT02669.1 histidinol-phosphate transaminase [Pseudomonadota bacterium]NBT17906.1 histidinol-phosphate transaminase [Pseudomonadota bacterium]
MSGNNGAGLVRPSVQALKPYVPGEQPQGAGWIKLNTNENWFVSPSVLAAVAAAATHDLRRYPDPVCTDLRVKLSARYGIDSQQIICGNGSDELLTMLIRAIAGEGDRIAFTDPSYSLYETLSHIQNAAPVPVPLGDGWQLPVQELVAVNAPLTFITTPHAPSGTAFRLSDLEAIAAGCAGVVVFDEAYVDFGGDTSIPLLERYPNVVVLRTMSKAFGLAGMRLGYAFGSRELIGALYRIKDSYNVDLLTQVAGCAALDAWDEYARVNQETAVRRDRVAAELHRRFGWRVWPSATNFILVEVDDADASEIVTRLKTEQILVRYFPRPRLDRSMRISVGSDAEMDLLLAALDKVVG